MRYKSFNGINLSEMGVGTYLGELDEETDARYLETLKEAVSSGINVVDTAINYRYMKSERVIGRLLEEVGREKVFVSTKGGYIPFDAELGDDPKDYFENNFIKTGLINPDEMTPQGHYLGKEFIEWCFRKSMENLGVDKIDLYFIHNPEEQLLFISKENFYSKIKSVFELLENLVSEGKLGFYGFATWHGFRISRGARQFLDLREVYQIAEEVAGENHHFRFIQLPYNLGMPEAFSLKNQLIDGESLSTIEACNKLGIYVYTSASIYQGQVIGRVPGKMKEFFGIEDDVILALQFVRSTPGVGTALIGMSRVPHLRHNLKLQNIEPVSPERFLTLFK